MDVSLDVQGCTSFPTYDDALARYWRRCHLTKDDVLFYLNNRYDTDEFKGLV